ncbi:MULTISPECIES: hypothetical protein [unclassified Sphingopyxis]|uniref:hypothetical protein n=1 Tax=Sphingopyxis sp. YF1 TaxID=2482763 RepID=UPI001F610A2A|nr:hypothetical protein [Sphingopyxis sp. YF1]UNU42136.1 hypothetical protein EAO27_04955 [Sphingopyxis sp. YF1]
MFVTTIALLLASHIDLLGNKDDVRICAAGFDLLADRAAAKGADDINVRVLREFSAMFAERLDELGGRDDAAVAEVKSRLPGGDAEQAMMSKCGAIIGALRGNDTLLDAARKLDAGSTVSHPDTANH